MGAREAAGNDTVVGDAEFIKAIGSAKTIEMSSFLMPDGPVLDALVEAAKRGAEVKLTLAGDAFAKTISDIKKANDSAALELRKAGATVDFNDGKQVPSTPLHMKAALIDGKTGYLNERNWPNDGKDTIVKITDPKDLEIVKAGVEQKEMSGKDLSSSKIDALKIEADVIANAPGHTMRVETESFGPGPIADALVARAKAGDEVQLIMVKSDAGPTAVKSMQELEAAGGKVRLNEGTGGEKMALGDGDAWVGSANATAGRPHTIDWGLHTTNQSTISQLGDHFNDAWNNAKPFDPKMEPDRGKAKESVER